MAHVPAINIRPAINIGQIMRQVIVSGKITRAEELVFLRAMVAEDPLTRSSDTFGCPRHSCGGGKTNSRL
jgi:hypothetical protein